MKTLTLPIFLRRPLTQQLFAFVPALLLTELFYHFHSFSLEFVGFLGTWFALDLIVAWLRRLLFRKGDESLRAAPAKRESDH